MPNLPVVVRIPFNYNIIDFVQQIRLCLHINLLCMCTCARSYYVRRRRVLWFQVPCQDLLCADLHGAVGTPFN